MMRTRFRPRPASLLAAACALALLAGCSSEGAPDLMRIRNTTTRPDEFNVSPAKPLETPPSLTALPPPTPGAQNRADATPIDDALVALGGSPAAASRSGIPAGDQALLGYAARYGSDPAIRETVAQEDVEWRRSHNMRVLERLADVNGYYDAYKDQQLNQQAEMTRLRRLGVAVPSAPPADLKER